MNLITIFLLLFPGAKKGRRTRVMGFSIKPGFLLHPLVLSLLILNEDADTHFPTSSEKKTDMRD